MTTLWPTVPLAEIVENGDISYGVVQPGREDSAGVPIVRVKDLRQGRIDAGTPLRVAPSVSMRHSRTVLRGGELLISVVGTIGESAVVPASLAGWNVARAIAVIRPRGVSADWIRLALETRDAQAEISGALNTTVQATLNLGDLKKLSIPMPDSAVRRAIVEVLGALDGKVAANNRLQVMVDDLLDAEFSRLALGRSTTELRGIADVNVGSVKPQPGADLRYLDISSVEQGVYAEPEKTSWDSAPGRARRALKFGDTVWSTVRPNRRSHALILDDDPLLVASTGLAVLSPKPGRVAGTYEAARRDVFVSYLESVAEGSAYPAVRADRFEEAPIPDIDAGEWEGFERKALPLRIRTHAANVESRALKRTRDELLPLLMSGKVRVRDGERVASEVL